MAQYYLVVFKYVSQHAVGVHGSVGSNMRVRKIRTPLGVRGIRLRNSRNSLDIQRTEEYGNMFLGDIRNRNLLCF